MKTIQVQLAAGWATEEWKLKRMFNTVELEEVADTKSVKLLRLKLTSTDSRLAVSGKYGFPAAGLLLEILIPQTYQVSSIPNGIELVGVKSGDAHILPPPSVEHSLRDAFHAAILNHDRLRIYNALKDLDRRLGDLWISSALLLSPALPLGDFGEKVGLIKARTDLRILFTHIEASIVCLKCERETPHVELNSNTGFFQASLVCETCHRDIELNVHSTDVFGHDCMMSRVLSASLWIFCACGGDCSHVNRQTPGGVGATIDFMCGCPSVKVPIVFERAHSKIGSPKVRIDPANSHGRRFKEGVALPMNGACKHYKKSFRWIKYACCDEWYACNQCHDSRASNHERDSEAEPATMLCGFCSMEQSLDHVCRACGKETTPGWSVKDKVSTDNVRRKPPHWKRRR